MFGALTPAGLTPGLRRDRDRIAADHVQCDEPVHGRDDRSLHRRPRRWRVARASGADRLCVDADHQPAPDARRLCDVRQGAAGRSFEQRWSVWAAGFGGSQTTDGNAALGSNNTTSSIAGTAVGADYRFSPDTIAGFALAGGGTSFSVANGGSGRSDLFQAGAFIRHTVGPAYISGALAYGWQDITTNRTVTVGRHRSVARASSTPTPSPAGSKAAIALSRPGSAASASRLTPPDSSRPSICRPMPSRPLSAPTRLRWPMAPRTSPMRAANSASAPTNPMRCRTAS